MRSLFYSVWFCYLVHKFILPDLYCWFRGRILFNPIGWRGGIWQILFVIGVFVVAQHFLIVTCGGGIPFVIAEIAFGILYAGYYVKLNPDPEFSNKPTKVPFMILLRILILTMVIWIVAFAAMGAYTAIATSATPQTSTPASQIAITTSQTTIPTTQTPELSCNILGKWPQARSENTPVTDVYIQIYSDYRIEIYQYNQLRSWGTWEVIAPDQFRNTWTGGKDAGTNTFTISPDCRTLAVVSFRGEHSTFIKL